GERTTGTAEGIQDNVPGLAAVAHGAFHQFHGLHRRVQIILDRLGDLPDVALVARATPIVIAAVTPSVEDGLVLALIVGATQRKRVLRPDNEGRPLTARRTEGRLQKAREIVPEV